MELVPGLLQHLVQQLVHPQSRAGNTRRGFSGVSKDPKKLSQKRAAKAANGPCIFLDQMYISATHEVVSRSGTKL